MLRPSLRVLDPTGCDSLCRPLFKVSHQLDDATTFNLKYTQGAHCTTFNNHNVAKIKTSDSGNRELVVKLMVDSVPVQIAEKTPDSANLVGTSAFAESRTRASNHFALVEIEDTHEFQLLGEFVDLVGFDSLALELGDVR